MKQVIRGHGPRIPLVVLGFAAILIAMVHPTLLAPLRRALAFFQRHVTNPLVMAMLFGMVITPAALVLRMLGKTPLQLRRGDSYWVSESKTIDMTRPF